MPQPFEQFNLGELQDWKPERFRTEARKYNINEKIGDLACFLVNNFRDEISSEEHCIDTAIRLLKNQVAENEQSTKRCTQLSEDVVRAEARGREYKNQLDNYTNKLM